MEIGIRGSRDLQEEFEDTKGKIRICKSKKERQRKDQKKKSKRTKNDLQNTLKKTKDRVIRTPLKIGVNSVPSPLVALVVLLKLLEHVIYNFNVRQ
jgi:hypothetical protein